MRVSILDFRKIVFEGHAKRVVLPCDDGELGVLDFHQPFLSSLKAGSIIITDPKKKEEIAIRIKGGIAKMKGNALVILTGEEAKKE